MQSVFVWFPVVGEVCWQTDVTHILIQAALKFRFFWRLRDLEICRKWLWSCGYCKLCDPSTHCNFMLSYQYFPYCSSWFFCEIPIKLLLLLCSSLFYFFIFLHRFTTYFHFYLKVIHHFFFLIQSPLCRSKPSRLLFIFKTQMKIFFI